MQDAGYLAFCLLPLTSYLLPLASCFLPLASCLFYTVARAVIRLTAAFSHTTSSGTAIKIAE